MLEGSCHCGAVKLRYDGLPKAVVICNCSICRRLAAMWGHGSIGVITIDAAPDATLGYRWGDKSLAFHTCRICGCTTHWLSEAPEMPRRAAINLRMVESAQISGLPLRHFDGADSWTYLD